MDVYLMFVVPRIDFNCFIDSFVSANKLFAAFIELALFALRFDLDSSIFFSICSIGFWTNPFKKSSLAENFVSLKCQGICLKLQFRFFQLQIALD